jgi:tetratricopeptide (TPR) repeat protein
MRTHLFRGVLAFAVAVLLTAPAFAQSIVKGTVVDAAGKPVAGASVLFEAVEAASRRVETKTNDKGEFLQVGVPSGNYRVTASKDQLKQTITANIRQGENRPMAFALTASSGLSDADRAAAAAVQAAAQEAVAALQAGQHDTAITKFQEVIAKLPTCTDCYYNMGVAYAAKQDYVKAEEAFKKVIELKADHAEAYSGLANIYNAQKKFDLAVQASQKASELSAATAGATGASAESMYNQGVVLWNAQKYAEAKALFEKATAADPKMSLAWYQLAMANLNLGQLPAAKEAFNGYLKADPNGPKAAEVQAMLKQLP